MVLAAKLVGLCKKAGRTPGVTYCSAGQLGAGLRRCALPFSKACVVCRYGGLQVTMQDFEAALDEVQPAFGANTESLQKHVMQVGLAGLGAAGIPPD